MEWIKLDEKEVEGKNLILLNSCPCRYLIYGEVKEDSITLYYLDENNLYCPFILFKKDSVDYDKTFQYQYFGINNYHEGIREIAKKLSDYYGYYICDRNKIRAFTIFDIFLPTVFQKNYLQTYNMPMKEVERKKIGGYLDYYNGNECVRVYQKYNNTVSQRGDKPKEWLRILIMDNGEFQFYKKSLIGWYRVDSKELVYYGLNININGKKPSHYKECKTVLALVLSLMYKGWNNIIKMKQYWLIDDIFGDVIASVTVESISKIRFSRFNEDGCSFAKMINVPQFVVDELIAAPNEMKSGLLSVINKLQVCLYDHDNEKDVFRYIDKKSFKEIANQYYSCAAKYSLNLDSFSLSTCITRFTNYSFNILGLLFHISGKLNWINKLLYVFNIDSEDDRVMYHDYLFMAAEVGVDVWKVDISNIKEIHDEVVLLYNAKENDDYNNTYCESFRLMHEEWESLCYSSDNLSIIAPEKPSDLINEGVKLNHCVKSYVEKVAAGETTILFIRKHDALNTPFYTLEIRDNAVRQCHGKCNCNMTEEVRKFVKKFCREKGIEFSDANRVLTV